MIQKLRDIWEDIKLTWVEWHAVVIGLGDGLAFTKTDWSRIREYCPNDKFIEGELHYYKISVGIGRLIWGILIASVLVNLV